ncbi:hypothetical protein HifGL_001770 [Haemophilus influenzae KR494]|nr:hypothetical protein HifGL_001770 [Haemophilus influenzae KR494]
MFDVLLTAKKYHILEKIAKIEKTKINKNNRTLGLNLKCG